MDKIKQYFLLLKIKQPLFTRVGSITAEDIISFTVSNYDAMDMGDVNHIRETRDLGLDKR